VCLHEPLHQPVLGLRQAAVVLHAARAVVEVDVEDPLAALVELAVEAVRQEPLGAAAPATAGQGVEGAPQGGARLRQRRGEVAGRDAGFHGGLAPRATGEVDQRKGGDGGLVEVRELGRYVPERVTRLGRARRA
jgi:hypothetical protein